MGETLTIVHSESIKRNGTVFTLSTKDDGFLLFTYPIVSASQIDPKQKEKIVKYVRLRIASGGLNDSVRVSLLESHNPTKDAGGGEKEPLVSINTKTGLIVYAGSGERRVNRLPRISTGDVLDFSFSSHGRVSLL